jgi:hypothetical protein
VTTVVARLRSQASPDSEITMRASMTALILVVIAVAGFPVIFPPRPPRSASRPWRGATASSVFPNVIALPDGFFPQGIAFERGETFYVGLLSTGAIYRGDARTGTGALFVPAQPGKEEVGMKYDSGHGGGAGDRMCRELGAQQRRIGPLAAKEIRLRRPADARHLAAKAGVHQCRHRVEVGTGGDGNVHRFPLRFRSSAS